MVHIGNITIGVINIGHNIAFVAFKYHQYLCQYSQYYTNIAAINNIAIFNVQNADIIAKIDNADMYIAIFYRHIHDAHPIHIKYRR